MKPVLLLLAGIVLSIVGLDFCWNATPRKKAEFSDLPQAGTVQPVFMTELPRLPDRVDYETEVLPVLHAACMQCHAGASDGALPDFRQEPADWLFWLIPHEAFPQGCQGENSVFSKGHWQLIRRWIAEGAYWPKPGPRISREWDHETQNHWAFAPLRKPAIPEIRARDRIRNPIDAFILSRLEAVGLEMEQSARTEQLVRRLCLAVTGLVPTRAQIEQYAAADHYELDQFVEELLNDVGYGEHWGRYWLDVARYADTNGYEDDSLKPDAWKYRDWVIQAMNADLPYDEFVVKQLAGDLLPQASPQDFIAVGFLRLGAWDSEPNDALQDRFEQLDEIVSTCGLVFMGLSVGCARCHDHPEEPVTAQDYYRMVGLFDGLVRPTKGRLEEVAPSGTSAQLMKAERLQQQQRVLQREALLEKNDLRAKELRQQANALEAQAQLESAYRLVETEEPRAPTRLLLRGDVTRPGERIPAGIPAILADESWWEASSDRLRLAKWLIEQQQGLTARLLVNRIWRWHFGRGLCPSATQLGLGSEPPTHPELLEWLAAWFVYEADWSLKKLHHLILTSATFRAGSAASSLPGRRHLFGEFPPRPLRAEEIHDSLLLISGQLSRRLHGPPDYPFLPENLLATLPERGAWSNPTVERRRAIYQIVKRNLPNPFLEAFHFPVGQGTCVTRSSFSDASQATSLWYGDFSRECAARWADQMMATPYPNREMLLDEAFLAALGRYPVDEEKCLLSNHLTSSDEHSRLRELCLVLFNLHEFHCAP